MNQPILPYAAVILKLLSDILYHEDAAWETLLTYQSAVRQHFAAIGLALRLDEAEGYAYLIQPDPTQEEEWEGEEAPPALPRFVRRTRLTYDATLLCVLLREELQNFDAREPDLDRLVLTKAQIRELIRQFYPERADLTRLDAKIDRVISQVVAVGFLRRLSEQAEESYEVKRIIKAKLSADKLVEIRNQLVEYGESEKPDGE